MLRKASSYKLRSGRYSEEGRIYHITFTTHERIPYFNNLKNGRLLVNNLRASAPLTETLCYVVMPDHLHWLMQLNKGYDLPSTVQKVKSLTTKSLRQVGLLSGKPLWQKGFYDRGIRRDDDLQQVARYIIANPVRAGLVKSVREYSLWDAVWL